VARLDTVVIQTTEYYSDASRDCALPSITEWALNRMVRRCRQPMG